jgi:uncharacterized coiled-coil protein SlyX
MPDMVCGILYSELPNSRLSKNEKTFAFQKKSWEKLSSEITVQNKMMKNETLIQ